MCVINTQENSEGFANNMEYTFDFESWYENVYGQYKGRYKIPGYNYNYDEGKKLMSNGGWIINQDMSVTLLCGSGTISQNDAKQFIEKRKYPKHNNNTWSLEEKKDLFLDYCQWVKQQAHKHGRTEDEITAMFEKIKTF